MTGDSSGPLCANLPFDRYFELRARFAIRLWRALGKQPPGADPAALSRQTRDYLVLALRALDGRLAGASIRQIGEVLFKAPPMSARNWKTHDLRSRTERTIRKGLAMMEGDYRKLLLHPYRRRIPQGHLSGIDLTHP